MLPVVIFACTWIVMYFLCGLCIDLMDPLTREKLRGHHFDRHVTPTEEMYLPSVETLLIVSKVLVFLIYTIPLVGLYIVLR